MDTKPVEYVLIKPAERLVTSAKFKSIDEAYKAVHLARGAVDHGALGHGQFIVVFEYGLLKPVEQQHLFAIGKSLFEGNAVIGAEDSDGERIDAHEEPVRWFKDADEVWQAIEQGEVIQPSLSVNGEVLWVWPDQRVG